MLKDFVVFDDVCKHYLMGTHTIKAADHVSFRVDKGEFCVIVGPSGAGKTTVLNMLGGMDSCDSGRILLDGREISALDEKQLTDYRRYDVGFVFQFYNLVQNLTALRMWRWLRKYARTQSTRKRRWPWWDSLTARLTSVGTLRRRSSAWLLPGPLKPDPPLRQASPVPDFEAGRGILRLLHETCKKTGKTVFVITHNQAITNVATASST